MNTGDVTVSVFNSEQYFLIICLLLFALFLRKGN